MQTNKLIMEIVNKDDDMQLRVGEIIRLRRYQLRLERRELAERTDLSINTIRSIEDDKTYSPRWETAAAILNAMGIKLHFELDDKLEAEANKRNGR